MQYFFATYLKFDLIYIKILAKKVSLKVAFKVVAIKKDNINIKIAIIKKNILAI